MNVRPGKMSSELVNTIDPKLLKPERVSLILRFSLQMTCGWGIKYHLVFIDIFTLLEDLWRTQSKMSSISYLISIDRRLKHDYKRKL